MKIFKKIKSTVRSVYYGISNLIRWAPIIYKDRDFDQEFLLEIMQFKMKSMEKFFLTEAWSVNSHENAKQLKKAQLVLKRLIDDDYVFNAVIPVDEKYGETQMQFYIDYNGHHCMKFLSSEEEDKARKRAYDHSKYMKKQDTEYLCKIIQKYLHTWWD